MSKFKLFFTTLLVIVYWAFLSLYNLYESPIRGMANAQQLNNSVHDYAWGNFVAHNGIPHMAFWILIVTLAILWIPSILRKCSGKQ